MTLGTQLRILLVEDNPGDARLLEIYLAEIETFHGQLYRAENLQEALRRLERHEFDIILLDLSLPDSHGLGTLTALGTTVDRLPVIILTGIHDEEIGVRALRQGAQDYLVKGQVTPALLGRSMRYAVERHRLRHELEAKQRLAAAGETVASIAHYIKNVLQRLVGSEHLVEKMLSEGRYDLISQVWPTFQRATTDLRRYVEDMLKFVRMPELDLADGDLNALIRGVHDLCIEDARAQGIELELKLEPELPLVKVDHSAMNDALLNLVNNALDACSNRAGARITICTDYLPQQSTVRVLVCDNGPGIPTEIQEKIFSPFYTTKGHGGTGLGLAVVRKAVEAHHGRLSLSSADGETTFCITLRAGREGAAAPAETTAAESSPK